MKKPLLIICLFIFLVAFIQPGNNSTIFRQLYGLEGMWIMKTKKGFIGEEWIKMDKDHLQNRGFIVKGTDTIITETVALRINKDGIAYTSIVENQNNKQPVSFKLTSSENNIFVFENPSHDFPKRITYHLVNKDSVYAWIDGGKEHPDKRSSFGYSRIK